MELFDLEELIPVAQLGDTDILFVKKEFVDDETALAVRVFADNSHSYSFGLVQKFWKFIPYDTIDPSDENAMFYYRNRISKTFDGESVLSLIEDYRDELEKWSDMEDKWGYAFSKVYTDERK